MKRKIEKKQNTVQAVENIYEELKWSYEYLSKESQEAENEGLANFYKDKLEVYNAVFKFLEKML